jgi:GNAT superfamily N-acetyltransferase
MADSRQLRDFRAEDQVAVRSLVLAGLGEHWGVIDESLNPDLADIAASYSDGRTVVVEVDGTLVGTGTVVPREDGVAEIVRMSVHRDFRRRGIGRVIADELKRTAATWGASAVVLETSAHWDGVVAFYSRCGFGVTHHVDGDFGRDAWFEHPLR